MTFDLLIKHGRNGAGRASEPEIAVWTNPPNHIARFIQGTNH
jgi:hypothetical protein